MSLCKTKQPFFSEGIIMWMYRGTRVQLARTAEISSLYRPGACGAEFVQQVLDGAGRWNDNHDAMIATGTFSATQFKSMVVPVSGNDIMWAVHVGHRANNPEPSPFVRVDAAKAQTNMFTVEMIRAQRRLMLVRAYAGDYTPPLPWQTSASQAEGGFDFCVEFWRTHAFAWSPSLTRAFVNQPPWFSKLAA